MTKAGRARMQSGGCVQVCSCSKTRNKDTVCAPGPENDAVVQVSTPLLHRACMRLYVITVLYAPRGVCARYFCSQRLKHPRACKPSTPVALVTMVSRLYPRWRGFTQVECLFPFFLFIIWERRRRSFFTFRIGLIGKHATIMIAKSVLQSDGRLDVMFPLYIDFGVVPVFI